MPLLPQKVHTKKYLRKNNPTLAIMAYSRTQSLNITALKRRKQKQTKKLTSKILFGFQKFGVAILILRGGVDAYVSFTNKSSKTIKYITWTVIPYNAVGDVVYSEIGYKSEAHLSDTGPYAQGQGHGSGWYWSCVWYNSTITSIKLSEIEIEYTDGSNKTISGNDINYVCY